MNDPNNIDPYGELFGLDLPPERLQEVLKAYGDILGEIRKLRMLDLTDVHPAVVFEPNAPYRKTP
jgi:putative NADH-flavin reductase